MSIRQIGLLITGVDHLDITYVKSGLKLCGDHRMLSDCIRCTGFNLVERRVGCTL